MHYPKKFRSAMTPTLTAVSVISLTDHYQLECLCNAFFNEISSQIIVGKKSWKNW